LHTICLRIFAILQRYTTIIVQAKPNNLVPGSRYSVFMHHFCCDNPRLGLDIRAALSLQGDFSPKPLDLTSLVTENNQFISIRYCPNYSGRFEP
jgi:hypothetical protein